MMDLDIIMFKNLVTYLSLPYKLTRFENILQTLNLYVMYLMCLFILQAKIELEAAQYWLMVEYVII